jgi:hypothetical protein
MSKFIGNEAMDNIIALTQLQPARHQPEHSKAGFFLLFLFWIQVRKYYSTTVNTEQCGGNHRPTTLPKPYEYIPAVAAVVSEGLDSSSDRFPNWVSLDWGRHRSWVRQFSTCSKVPFVPCKSHYCRPHVPGLNTWFVAARGRGRIEHCGAKPQMPWYPLPLDCWAARVKGMQADVRSGTEPYSNHQW